MAQGSGLVQDPAAHLAAFQRGSVDLIDEQQLVKLIAASLEGSRPLRIKFGMDPSTPDLHLGHAIPLMALRDLQVLGHQIVLIVGDATAMVGDPSGRNKLRPVLTRKDVDGNLATYTEQAGLVLDMERTEVRRNSEWFDTLGFEGLLNLTTRMTVSQMIERDTFKTRVAAGEPIGINEFLYPLMQGWDSVKVKCDVEFGGTDQLFNLIVGRRLQEQEGQRPQCVRTHGMINGLDGRKMSKSYGNAIGVLGTPREMTFGVMRLDDELMSSWFTQLTRLSDEEIEECLALHPRQAKARLAHEITAYFHGQEEASAASQAFDREVRDKALPEEVPEVAWGEGWGESHPLANMLAGLQLPSGVRLVSSTSEARRMVKQGAVRLDGEVQSDPMAPVTRPAASLLVQIGKKRFARVQP